MVNFGYLCKISSNVIILSFVLIIIGHNQGAGLRRSVPFFLIRLQNIFIRKYKGLKSDR